MKTVWLFIIVRIFFLGIFVYEIFYDIFNPAVQRDINIAVGVICLYIFVVFGQSRSRIFLSSAFLLLLFLGYELFIAGPMITIERISVWTYVLLVVGIVQKFFEIKDSEKYKN